MIPASSQQHIGTLSRASATCIGSMLCGCLERFSLDERRAEGAALYSEWSLCPTQLSQPAYWAAVLHAWWPQHMHRPAAACAQADLRAASTLLMLASDSPLNNSQQPQACRHDYEGISVLIAC